MAAGEFPAVSIVKAVLRDSRYLDVEVSRDRLADLDTWGAAAGDVVQFGAGVAPVEPENAVFVLDDPVRKGAVLTLRLEGPYGEEGRVCSKRLLKGSCFTVLTKPKNEFTVHRHVSVEGPNLIKLHFAHGGQIQKLNLGEGCPISIKEKPAGILDFTVVEPHTEDLDRCPNCNTGLKGPRQKQFNAADLCKAGTQWAIIRPKEQPRNGIFFVAEREHLPKECTLRFVARAAERPSPPPKPAELEHVRTPAPERQERPERPERQERAEKSPVRQRRPKSRSRSKRRAHTRGGSRGRGGRRRSGSRKRTKGTHTSAYGVPPVSGLYGAVPPPSSLIDGLVIQSKPTPQAPQERTPHPETPANGPNGANGAHAEVEVLDSDDDAQHAG